MGFTIVHGNAGTFEQQQALAQGMNQIGQMGQVFQKNRQLDMAAKKMQQDQENYQAELARAQETQAYNRARQGVVDDRNTALFDQRQADRARLEADRIATEGADAQAASLGARFQAERAPGAAARHTTEALGNDVFDMFKGAIAGAVGRDAAEMFPSTRWAIPGKDYEEFLNAERLDLLDSGDLSETSAKMLAEEYSLLHQQNVHKADTDRLNKRNQHFANTVEGYDAEHGQEIVDDFANNPDAEGDQFELLRQLKTEAQFNTKSFEVASALAGLRKEGTIDIETLDSLDSMLEDAEDMAGLLKVSGLARMTPPEYRAVSAALGYAFGAAPQAGQAQAGPPAQYAVDNGDELEAISDGEPGTFGGEDLRRPPDGDYTRSGLVKDIYEGRQSKKVDQGIAAVGRIALALKSGDSETAKSLVDKFADNVRDRKILMETAAEVNRKMADAGAAPILSAGSAGDMATKETSEAEKRRLSRMRRELVLEALKRRTGQTYIGEE